MTTANGFWITVATSNTHEPEPPPGPLSKPFPGILPKWTQKPWMQRHPRIQKAAIQVDGRFAMLLFAAELCLSRGFGYGFIPATKGDPPAGLLSVSHVWINVYCAAWILAGLLCVLLAFNRRRWVPAMAFVALPSFMWASSYFATWVSQGDKSWLPCLLYHAVSGMIFWIAWGAPRGGWRE